MSDLWDLPTRSQWLLSRWQVANITHGVERHWYWCLRGPWQRSAADWFRGVDHGGWGGGPDPLKICKKGQSNVTFFHLKLLLDNCQVSHHEGWKIVSKMEGETNFSRRLKQFDGLSWLTPTPIPYFTTNLRHWTDIVLIFAVSRRPSLLDVEYTVSQLMCCVVER